MDGGKHIQAGPVLDEDGSSDRIARSRPDHRKVWISLPSGIVNVGKPGQESRAIASRFSGDVLSRHPATEHILAGTNDVRLSDSTGIAYVRTMAGAAASAGSCVILGTIPPIMNVTLALPIPKDRAALTIAVDLWNANIRALASASSYLLADYHSLFTTANGSVREELLGDGIHPNATGYELMLDEAEKRLGECKARQQ